MKFELTIAGLCIIAMKSDNKEPVHPEAVDVIVPDAEHHKCRFIWDPEFAVPSREPEMIIAPNGRRYASLELDQRALRVSFDANPNTTFNVHWGATAEKPSADWEETWMNWVPKLGDLGFDGFDVPDAGLPDGARARLTLPPGTLASLNPVLDVETNEYVLWEYPAAGKIHRALANEVVYVVEGAQTIIISDDQGEIVRITADPFETVQMCISNDMEVVPKDYTADTSGLEHLEHLNVISTGTFQMPTIVATPRTGHKICDQVIHVYPGR